MPELYLTPASISYLSQFLLALLVAVYLSARIWIHKKQPLTHQSGYLVAVMSALSLFLLLMFLESSFLPGPRLYVVAVQNTALALTLLFLIQFAYQTPPAMPKPRWEPGLVMAVNAAYALTEAGVALWRLGLMRQGQVIFRPDFLDFFPLAGFLWVAFIFARQRHNATSRGYMLIFLIPVWLAALNAVRTFFPVPIWFYQINLSVGILLAICLFALNYLHSGATQASFLARFTLASITSMLAIFGIVAWLVTPVYRGEFLPPAAASQTTLFEPNQSGGYDVRQSEFNFEQPLGEKLPLTNSPRIRPSVEMPFDFTFYGQRYNSVWIFHDGAVSFGGAIEQRNLELNFASPAAIFAVLLDLNPDASADGGIFARREADRLIITYYRLPAYYQPQDIYTSQLILHADGRFSISLAELPATLRYIPNSRPDAALWAMGAKPASTPQQRVDFSRLPLNTGPGGALQDFNLAFRVFEHRLLLPVAAGILFGSLSILIVLPVTLHYWMRRPLQDLLRGIQALESGRRQISVPVRHNDEIGYLAQSFNTLSRELDDLISGLEARVDERTRDLKESNLQLQKLSIAVEQSPSPIAITNLEAGIEYVNPAFTRASGYTLDEVLGQNPRILQSGLTPPDTYKNLWETLTAGQTWHGEFVNRHKDGSVYWESTLIAPIRNADGQITHYVAVKQDVTDRISLEQSLRQSEQQYRILADFTYDWEYWLSPDRTFVHNSPSVERITGYTREEFFAKPQLLLEIVHPEDRPLVEKHLADENIGNAEDTLEFRIHRKDGTEHWLSHACAPVRLTDGTYAGRRAANRDITERKRLEESERRFSQLLASLNEVTTQISLAPTFDEMCRLAVKLGHERLGFDRLGLWFIDPHNPGYMVGSYGIDESGNVRDERHVRLPHSPAEVNQQLMADRKFIYHKSNVPVYNEKMEQIGIGDQAGVGLWDGNTVIGFLYADNFLNHVSIDVRHRELLMLYGQSIGHQGTITRAAENLKNLNATLEARVSERTRQLQETINELESFSYTVSHNLRSPLRAIHAYTRILAAESNLQQDAGTASLFGKIQNNTLNMGQMMDELLAYIKLGRRIIQKTSIKTHSLALDLVQDARSQGVRPQTQFIIHPLPDSHGDPALLRQVFYNLIGNALKFSRQCAEPRIEIGSQVGERGESIFFVRDNGAGFDMRYADKLFGAFQRLHHEDEFEGIGMGLAVARRIILLHGGRIWAEGQPGQGACIYFSLE